LGHKFSRLEEITNSEEKFLNVFGF